MSDRGTTRLYDTVIVPAALVFPDDPVPYMGPDAVRIPVRVVWRSPGDPVAKFLKVNEVLDRITGAATPEILGAAVPGRSGKDVPHPTAPVSVADDEDAAIRDARSPESFDQHAVDVVRYKTKNVNNSTARALGISRVELRNAIHDLRML